ncbi:hypothetical protein [Actinomadura keratinilytica]|uniref:Uncharacterized protein n=1 Tax=Actinomadura keratinilytica TaxID=547461 RepID=A0ABP7ZBA8_9ACTN
MFVVLVLVSLACLLLVGRWVRPALSGDRLGAPGRPGGPDGPGGHPESMTAVLDPADEEYLAWLADHLWPEDEYLDAELEMGDGEEEAGGGLRR